MGFMVLRWFTMGCLLYTSLCKGLLSRDIKIVSGGTDNHLMLVDLTNYDLTGKAVEKLLDAVNICLLYTSNVIYTDEKWLTFILSQIVQNAIKYFDKQENKLTIYSLSLIHILCRLSI